MLRQAAVRRMLCPRAPGTAKADRVPRRRRMEAPRTDLQSLCHVRGTRGAGLWGREGFPPAGGTAGRGGRGLGGKDHPWGGEGLKKGSRATWGAGGGQGPWNKGKGPMAQQGRPCLSLGHLGAVPGRRVMLRSEHQAPAVGGSRAGLWDLGSARRGQGHGFRASLHVPQLPQASHPSSWS